LASSLVRYILRINRSVFNNEKKLSIAALSQTSPDRLIEQTTPLIGHQPLELFAGALAAAIGIMQQRVRFLRRQLAINKASLTSWAVIAAIIDRPTTRREKRPTT
jgi:hypothetical protein